MSEPSTTSWSNWFGRSSQQTTSANSEPINQTSSVNQLDVPRPVAMPQQATDPIELEKKRIQTEKDSLRCEKWKGKLLKNSAMVKFMMENLERVGCPFDESHFVCTPCDTNRAGGFSPAVGVVLCQDKFLDRQHMEDTVTHELVHAFDHCTTNINWKSPEQHACAEIRAVNLSGECKFTREFRRGNFQIARHHQACVRRRAILGVKMLPGCETGTIAEDAVRVVWDSCFNDTAPFDEIP
ncbi:peptidase M76 family-domain-containing protein [Obelidium mucronatum]|nr:peptidase M76 family-domain-containing protein [Obelidium mucronatum]